MRWSTWPVRCCGAGAAPVDARALRSYPLSIPPPRASATGCEALPVGAFALSGRPTVPFQMSLQPG
jgi:hypothetical protein